MRIAFHAPMKPPTHAVPSGDRRMARLLIRALEAAGHEVELATRFRAYDGAGDAEAQTRMAHRGARIAARLIARYKALPLEKRPRAWFTYHLFHKAPDWIGPAVCDALEIPYYIAEASYAPKQAGGPWDRGHRAVAEALAHAKAVFCLNPDDIECLRPMVDDLAPLVNLRPFLDTAPYRAAWREKGGARNHLTEAYGLDSESPWLLAVGMMRPGDKLASYQVLADALAALGDRDWRLLIVGDGPMRAAVKTAFDQFSDQRIVWLGEQPSEALPDIYAACDLLVWPAINEAYGMAILEAQATGLPAVVGDVGGVGQIVEDGRTGKLTPVGDPGAMAEAIGALLAMPARRQAMAIAAGAKVLSQHSIHSAARVLASYIPPHIRNWRP